MALPILVIGLGNFWDSVSFGLEMTTAVVEWMTDRVRDLTERIAAV